MEKGWRVRISTAYDGNAQSTVLIRTEIGEIVRLQARPGSAWILRLTDWEAVHLGEEIKKKNLMSTSSVGVEGFYRK